jgi:hypothetical protein
LYKSWYLSNTSYTFSKRRCVTCVRMTVTVACA